MQMVLMPYDLFSCKKETTIRIKNLTIKIFLTQSKTADSVRWSSSITSNLIVPPHPSPCCLCLCWASTAYLSPFWRSGPALPSLNLTPFPSDPREILHWWARCWPAATAIKPTMSREARQSTLNTTLHVSFWTNPVRPLEDYFSKYEYITWRGKAT